MMYGKAIRAFVEEAIPGASLQYGYHGCHRASLQIFHEASGHGSGNPLLDWSCACEGWGNGRLEVKPSELVAACRQRLVKQDEDAGAGDTIHLVH